jgi:hypothetical protein
LGGCGGTKAAAPTTTSPKPATTVAPNKIVEAYVAARDIPRCTSADDLLGQQALVIGAVPGRLLPPNAVTSGSQLGQRFTSRPIPRGQVVTTDDVAVPPIPGCP